MAKKEFAPEYKREIVKLVTERGKKVSEVADDIDVSVTSIRRWIKDYGNHGTDAFPGKGHLHPEDAEIRDLKKKNRDLQEENEILKKAMAIFSRSTK